MTMILATDAKILFVDEPTTGLDPVIRADLWEKLNELKKTHFIFLTTHYLEEAERLADMIEASQSGHFGSAQVYSQTPVQHTHPARLFHLRDENW
jgi:ABC-type multidrug transport system ATPase subunit